MYTVQIVRDVAYAPHPACKIDFYLPKRETPGALVVYFHGGGLEGGERQDETVLLSLAREYGIAVATADYRMYPDAKYPEFLEDAAAAVAFARGYCAHSALWVGGTSAGGYLSMMLFADERYLENAGVSPRAVTGYLLDAGQPTVHFNVLRERGLDTRLVRIDEAAPLWYIDHDFTPDAPHLLLLYAGNDLVNRPEQYRLFYRTLAHFNYPMERVEIRCFEGYAHCGYYDSKNADGAYALMKLYADFIERAEGCQ